MTFTRYSKKIVFVILVLFATLLMGCSSDNRKTPPPPGKLTSGTECAACGMVIMKYAGPHAQIIWKNGKNTFYGNLLEAMPQVLNEITARRIAAIYVQDFSGVKWGSYYGKWINAKKAIFVVDSDKLSSMGVSYTAFATEAAAQAFQKKNGGRVLSFDQITQEVFTHTQDLMRKNPGKYTP